MDEATEATEAMMVTMEAVEEVTAATADPAGSGQARGTPRHFALTRCFSCTGRCSKGMRQHGGSTDVTTEAVEEAATATAALVTTRVWEGAHQDVHWHSQYVGTHHSPSRQGVGHCVTAQWTLQRPKLK